MYGGDRGCYTHANFSDRKAFTCYSLSYSILSLFIDPASAFVIKMRSFSHSSLYIFAFIAATVCLQTTTHSVTSTLISNLSRRAHNDLPDLNESPPPEFQSAAEDGHDPTSSTCHQVGLVSAPPQGRKRKSNAVESPNSVSALYKINSKPQLIVFLHCPSTNIRNEKDFQLKKQEGGKTISKTEEEQGEDKHLRIDSKATKLKKRYA